VATGAGDFQCALGGLLPANVFEIDRRLLGVAQQSITIHLQRGNAIAGVHEMNDVHERFHGIDIHPADHRGFPRVDLGHDQACKLFRAGFNRDGQSSANPRIPPSSDNSPTNTQSGSSFLFKPP
jgi:hypothetical protein